MIFNYLRKTVFASLLVGAFAANAADTNVAVYLKSGDKSDVKVSETGFIYFADNVMNVVPTGAEVAPLAFPLANIQKLVFSDATGSPRVLGAGEVALYPTVATNQVFLANASSSIKQIQIVDMAGKVVLSSAYEAGQAIEVGKLAAGVYVLKADNLTFKFQKK
ncbi:MAG: T9SS type A sorting domain-containing protein [Paludibacteraceae bacterium]|nr:T9SS type A sorting domain-containing protein [Paludibacteraceae bacterium]